MQAVSYCDIAKVPHDKLFQVVAQLAESWPEGEEYLQQYALKEVQRVEGISLKESLTKRKGATLWVGNIPERYATVRATPSLRLRTADAAPGAAQPVAGVLM